MERGNKFHCPNKLNFWWVELIGILVWVQESWNWRISFPVMALLKSDLVKVVYPGSACTVVLLCFFRVIPLFRSTDSAGSVCFHCCLGCGYTLVSSLVPSLLVSFLKWLLNGFCINHWITIKYSQLICLWGVFFVVFFSKLKVQSLPMVTQW